MKTTTKFDCVPMKQQAAEILYEQLKTVTFEEQLAYWKEGTGKLRQQQALRRSSNRLSAQ